ncbi:hypothetical protein [Achromobacter xylosoxidans]|uniref:Uncharacterized protein n=1 Tax=Achromobacter phage JWX TaxID=1589746 RepID=A0A0B5A6R1_9CAUD|nr:hypothetical protein [Achromobacter xylosoxidans]YP_009196245.1 hypothetical protein AVV28_gp56 [Achromobacter phage JWX]AJD82826.1 hypothetical protein JWX_00061 [Achromobacter phage JWX]WLW38479.1 hypothetical protein JWT_00056 [Achromobacter phage JWT]WNO48505.1 hypothetical protein [Achromobacter phage SE2]
MATQQAAPAPVKKVPTRLVSVHVQEPLVPVLQGEIKSTYPGGISGFVNDMLRAYVKNKEQ